jgi:hypothetical protein
MQESFQTWDINTYALKKPNFHVKKQMLKRSMKNQQKRQEEVVIVIMIQMHM